jgi:hypothetical protein
MTAREGVLVAGSAAYESARRSQIAPFDGVRRPVEREPGRSYSKSEFFRRDFPADVTAELVAGLENGRRQRETRVLDFTPWAGA